MTLSLRLTSHVCTVARWANEHPLAVRMALTMLPVVVALAVALFTHSSAYACPIASGGGGCGD